MSALPDVPGGPVPPCPRFRIRILVRLKDDGALRVDFRSTGRRVWGGVWGSFCQIPRGSEGHFPGDREARGDASLRSAGRATVCGLRVTGSGAVLLRPHSAGRGHLPRVPQLPEASGGGVGCAPCAGRARRDGEQRAAVQLFPRCAQ